MIKKKLHSGIGNKVRENEVSSDCSPGIDSQNDIGTLRLYEAIRAKSIGPLKRKC